MNQEAKRFGDAVAAYLDPHVGVLKDYKWKMGKGVPKEAAKLGLIAIDKEGGVAATNALRSDVARKAREVHLLAGNTRQFKMNELCKFVICQWGALGSNGDDTIEAYARVYTNAAIPDLSAICSLQELRVQANCNFPFKGIASWSKWLNFVWPEWALIYDARIAFALNAIHVMKGVDARAFPVPPGRDKLLSTLDSQTLAALSYLKRQRKHIPDVPNGEYVNTLADWLKSGTIAEGDAYEFYLMVMRRVQDVIGRVSFPAFVDVEMLLFYLSNRQLVHDLLLLMSDSIRRA
ncbi:hypothetical protein [Burkholderia ubonensis]|uniref:Uncharacterized protein n=1 Tax=Burkholderia ubonensis subsp. mesacidophila TaxID=265293 RepID=A0A2A4FIQ2_9BURK|nr:hypothetical protein [Burkholderia ubonensis]PCE32540.1 hypothetical protein BZL54_09985 [Burkholderia ubonensis subsp. mesacidophila]